jgi:hypothetical protein
MPPQSSYDKPFHHIIRFRTNMAYPAASTGAHLLQIDLDKLDLVDLDQVDADDEGPIKPVAKGLALEIRRSWQASVEEAVLDRLADREAEMRASMQVSLQRYQQVLEPACMRHLGTPPTYAFLPLWLAFYEKLL